MRELRNYVRLVGKLLVKVKRHGNARAILEVEEHVKRAKDMMDSLGATIAGGDKTSTLLYHLFYTAIMFFKESQRPFVTR